MSDCVNALMIRGEGGTGDVPGEQSPSPYLSSHHHLNNPTNHPHPPATLLTVKILLTTVLSSIIEVVILCTAGYILARAGILDKPTQRKLNVVNGMSLQSFGYTFDEEVSRLVADIFPS